MLIGAMTVSRYCALHKMSHLLGTPGALLKSQECWSASGKVRSGFPVTAHVEKKTQSPLSIRSIADKL